ncbi:hypothetical protein GQX74_003559, partial [Glossina fuscipes]
EVYGFQQPFSYLVDKESLQAKYSNRTRQLQETDWQSEKTIVNLDGCPCFHPFKFKLSSSCLCSLKFTILHEFLLCDFLDNSSICGGLCCTNATEIELRKKATIEFERLLHHHTKSLRGILESTANWFQYILGSVLVTKKK